MFKKKPIILPKGAEKYDPQAEEKKKWIKERTKKTEEVSQDILDYLKDKDYYLVDIYNACQVISKKIFDFIQENTKEESELAIKREQVKTLSQLYAEEKRKK